MHDPTETRAWWHRPPTFTDAGIMVVVMAAVLVVWGACADPPKPPPPEQCLEMAISIGGGFGALRVECPHPDHRLSTHNDLVICRCPAEES